MYVGLQYEVQRKYSWCDNDIHAPLVTSARHA